MIEVVGAHRMRMQLEAGEVGHPRQVGRMARHDLVGAAARREADRRHLRASRAAWPAPLLEEEFAADAVGVAHQHARAAARAAQCRLGDGDVVARRGRSCGPWPRDQRLRRMRDDNVAAVDGQCALVLRCRCHECHRTLQGIGQADFTMEPWPTSWHSGSPRRGGLVNEIALEETASTNAHALDLLRSGAAPPHLTLVWARRQTNGRGRGGRLWLSPEGNVFFSMILRPHRIGET
jgi:hypothetical protein